MVACPGMFLSVVVCAFIFNLMFSPQTPCLPSNVVVEGGLGVLYCCVSIPLVLECLPASGGLVRLWRIYRGGFKLSESPAFHAGLQA